MSASDFDFFYGSWHIAHRRLKKWLAECTEWDEFESHTVCRPILGGAGNMDEGYIAASDYHAMTLRLYEPETDEWSLYWITSKSGQAIEPPVVGRFSDGTGLFYQPYVHEGTEVVCRYKWSDIKPDSVRWEQAFSADDGETWETNWIMESTRITSLSAIYRCMRQNVRMSGCGLSRLRNTSGPPRSPRHLGPARSRSGVRRSTPGCMTSARPGWRTWTRRGSTCR